LLFLFQAKADPNSRSNFQSSSALFSFAGYVIALVGSLLLDRTGGTMATCVKCGSVLSEGAAFCTVCGSPVSAVSGPVPAAGAGIASNVAAALSYLLGPVTGIIFLMIEPHRREPFVRFHAFQAIFFGVVVLVLSGIWNNILWAGFFSFGFFWRILSLAGNLVGLGILFFWLFLMYKAYNNERYMIPFIGEFALRQASK